MTSRYCPAPAAEQVMDLLPSSRALEEMCVSMCAVPSTPLWLQAARSCADASNAQAAFDELEKRVSSFARALKMHVSLAHFCTYFCLLLGRGVNPCS